MREKEPHTTLLLVRHGEPDYPEDRIYSRSDDPGLTAKGLMQAKALAEWARGEKIDALYVSPTRRTRETAGPVAESTGLEAVVDVRLEERMFGIWEGMDFDAIQSGYPEEFRSWKTDPVGFAPEGGETIQDLADRVEAAFAEIRERHQGGTALLVSHVGTMRAALCAALGTPLEAYRRFHIRPGSVVRVDYGKRQANLMYLGFQPGAGSAWGGGQT
ncbi:MAG: histidine phosphatase family protein [Leptospirillia bacterium]